MCTFDYVLHRCGHSMYEYVEPTTAVCQADTEDDRNCNELLQNYYLSDDKCKACITRPDRSNRNLPEFDTIISLLEEDLTCLLSDKTRSSTRAAYQAVQLLSSAHEKNWASDGSMPSVEMTYDLAALAADAVEKATQEQNLRQSLSLQSQPDTASTVSGVGPSTETGRPEQFSQGTIDRQLCTVERSLCQLQPRQRMDDESSVITNPFCSTPTTAAASMPNTAPSACRAATVRSYLDGRDNWECDFCGPECFCKHLDD